jgi:hypothetical protein
MKAPTTLLNRPGRAAAVVGAVVAVSATTLMALVAGTAAASEPGRCVENVNVRAEPDVASRIVAMCEAGTEVQVGETRNGFVRLTDLGGWSAQEYVSVNGAAPAAPADRAPAAPDTTPAPSDRDPATTPSPSAGDGGGSGDSGDSGAAPTTGAGSARGGSGDEAAPTNARVAPRQAPAPEPAPQPAPDASPVGGLLG